MLASIPSNFNRVVLEFEKRNYLQERYLIIVTYNETQNRNVLIH